MVELDQLARPPRPGIQGLPPYHLVPQPERTVGQEAQREDSGSRGLGPGGDIPAAVAEEETKRLR